MSKCEICSKPCRNFASLSKHIRDTHKDISLQEYSDLYFGTSSECPECKNAMKWISFANGYKCSRSCGAIRFRRELKQDPERFEQFSNKLSNLQRDVWIQREVDGTKSEMFEQIGKTIRENNSKLTYEERRERFGWMNKIDPSLGEKGREKDLYYAAVRSITEANYKLFKQFINPNDLPRGKKQYHIDHKVSIADGYLNDVPASIVASPANLEMLFWIDNQNKNFRSSISIQTLYEANDIWEKRCE